MRHVIFLTFLVILLSGCKGDYPWRTEYRGTIKEVWCENGGLIFEFEDGKRFSDPIQADEWRRGEVVELQSERSGGGCATWRMVYVRKISPRESQPLMPERKP